MINVELIDKSFISMNTLDDILDAMSIDNVDVVALYQFVSVQDSEALKLEIQTPEKIAVKRKR